jgi:arabinogalactan oligomer / maltooligosaccharide transport system permease protein
MTTIDTLEEAEAPFAGSQVSEAPGPERLRFGDLWWRYLVSVLAIAFAIFPALYVVSAAFNPVPSLSSASLIPDSLTLENFREILTNPEIQGEKTNVHYLNWYVNSMIVAFFAALCTVILGALAAYAFARFRFKGRRFGMLSLLLIQMFPQFLAVVAIYLILLRTGEIFPVIGLNSRTGLIIVYLGGALGINAWLMKGFFDSIPNELDESARVDGATPAQIFWGIILPLGAPVLAVVGLLSFIATMNEYIIASRLMQSTNNFTLPVGMYGFISDQYGQRWGPFCAGVVLAAIPVIVIFLFLQRFIVHGLTSGSVKG